MTYRIVAIVLLAFLVSPLASQQTLPSNDSGRPGSFHFVPGENAEKFATEVQTAHESLLRLEGAIAAMPDENMRRQMQNDLASVLTLVNSLEQRNKPAGVTAATVERQLNAEKGRSHCGVCHGGDNSMQPAH